MGSRVQPAAPAAEADRGGAGAQRRRGRTRGAARGRDPPRPGRALSRSRHHRVPGRRAPTRGCRIRLYRGQRKAAGRAHGDRRGDRARSRAVAAGDRRGPHAARPRSRPGARTGPARDSDPGPGQPGDHGQGRRAPADRRDPERLCAALGAGRPRRWVRLCRLPHEPALRFAAGQTDRARAGHAGRGAQTRSGPKRVRHRRCSDQHPLPAGAGRAAGLLRRRRRHRLCGAQHRGAGRRSGGAGPRGGKLPGTGAQDGRREDRRT